MRRLRLGIVVLLVGLWIWLSALGVPHISFSRNWPLLIVALGAYIVFRAVRRARRKHRRQVRYVIDDLESGRIGVEEAIGKMRGGERE